MPIRLRLLVLVPLLLAAVSTSSQTGGPERVTLPVTVLDRKGGAIEGLKPENFRALLSGQVAPVKSVTSMPGGRRIVLLMDVSGSMRPLPRERWKYANSWAAARVLIRALKEGHSFAVLTFGDEVRMIATFGTQWSEIDATLQKASENNPVGRTKLFDALDAGVQLLEPAETGDAIIIFTDGEDSASRMKAKEIQSVLRSSRVRLFPVFPKEIDWAYFQQMDPSLWPELYLRSTSRTSLVISQRALLNFSEESGGLAAWISSSQKLDQRIETTLSVLIHSFRTSYSLELEIARVPHKAAIWSIVIVDSKGRKQKNLTVLYPRRIAAPRPQKSQAN